MSIERLSDAYLKNYVNSYQTKLTSNDETSEVTETETKEVETAKTQKEIWNEIADTYSKSSSASDLYLNYGNVTKASDLIGDDLDTTIFNVRKLIYGTQGSLVDSISFGKSKSADYSSGDTADYSNGTELSEDMKEKLEELKNENKK